MVDFNVTRRTLVLGARDSTTGWRSKRFRESTVKLVIMPRGSSFLSLVPGTYVKMDAIGVTVDVVKIGDEIQTGARFYEVKTVNPQWVGDSFEYRTCDLTELPLHFS